MSTVQVDLYDHVYADFASDAEAAVRREAFGEDMGQSSWITSTEWLSFADRPGSARAPTSWRSGVAPGGRVSTWRKRAGAA